jgi:hypothetical protein
MQHISSACFSLIPWQFNKIIVYEGKKSIQGLSALTKKKPIGCVLTCEALLWIPSSCWNNFRISLIQVIAKQYKQDARLQNHKIYTSWNIVYSSYMLNFK